MSTARITLAATDQTAGAFASAQQRFAQLGMEAQAISEKFAAVSRNITTLLGGVGLTVFFKQVVDGLDALNDLKDATGASIENLSGLEDVAARTGTSFQTVGAALVKFNAALSSAKDGSDAAEVFKRLGLSVQELKDQDPALALQETAKALAGFADDGNKARAVQELFGKSLREVAPVLADLAQAGALNSKVTEEQTLQAEKFSQALSASAKNSTDLARAVVTEVLPGLNALLETLRGTGESTQKFSVVAAAVRTAFEAIVIAGAYVIDTLQGMGREIGAIAAQVSALGRLDLKGFTAISQAVKEDGERAAIEIAKFRDRMLSAGSGAAEAGAGRGFVNPPGIKAPSIGDIGGGKGGKPQADLYQRYLDQLRDSILKTRELSAVEQARIDINKGLAGTLSAASQQQLLGVAASLDAVRALQQAEKDAARLAEAGKQFTERFRTDQEKLAEDVATADRLVQAGAISWKTYGRAATKGLTDAMAALDKQAEALPKIGKPLQEINLFAEQAGRNIQDALGESLTRALEGNFKSIGDLWADTLRKMVAQAAAAQLNTYLFGDTFGQKGGSLGGLVGSLFTGGLFGGARANGGPVSSGRAYLVGERGPEIFSPTASGTIIPNGAGGASVVINQTINVGQGVSRGEVYAAAMQAKDAAKAEIMQTLYRTGRGAYA